LNVFLLALSIFLTATLLVLFLKFKKGLKKLEDAKKDKAEVFLAKASETSDLSKENSSLNSRIKEIENDFSSREKSYLTSISVLQESFQLEQKSIQERKSELDLKEKELLKNLKELEEKLSQETESRKKVTSQRKSSEVRLGYIAETLAPFLDQFEFEPEECTFLGQPIDYISFGEEEVTFIEVKSGKSQLSSKQRRIRDQVKDKKVKWKEVRIK
jgi:predicted Holliday junction resolvase-like endonuclease